MDKALFIAMNGANQAMNRLSILTNNLANLNTTGFKGDFPVMQPFPVNNTPSRVYSTMDRTYSDFQLGPIVNTDRDLDVAITTPGYFAVQNATGAEGYTRAGSLQISPDGLLTTSDGRLVLGDSGLINIPPADRISISQDGTVSIHPVGTNGTELINVGKIKLVNPPTDNLQKGDDGLFYPLDGQTAQADNNVRLLNGAVEASNVSPMVALTDMIELSRDYERQMNLMRTESEDANTANQLLQLSI